AVAGVRTGVVVLVLGVDVPDEQAVLVREPLDPVRPVGETEVVRTGLEVLVVPGVLPALGEVLALHRLRGRALHAGEAVGGPAVLARLDVVGEDILAVDGDRDVVQEGAGAGQTAVGLVAPPELDGLPGVVAEVVADLLPVAELTAVVGTDLLPGGAAVGRDLGVEDVVVLLGVGVQPGGHRRRARAGEVDHAAEGGVEVVAGAGPPLLVTR